jgi:hypothetical protein
LQFYHQNLRFSEEQRLTVGTESGEYPIKVRNTEDRRNPNPDGPEEQTAVQHSDSAGYHEAIARGWQRARQEADSDGQPDLSSKETAWVESLFAAPDPITTRLEVLAPHRRDLVCLRMIGLAAPRIEAATAGPEAAHACLALALRINPADSSLARVADMVIASWTLVSHAELCTGATAAARLAAEAASHLLPLSTGDALLYLVVTRARAEALEAVGDAEAAEARREARNLEQELRGSGAVGVSPSPES